MPDTLSALDASFLELEEQSEGALMSIGGVMVFADAENTPDIATLAFGIEDGIEELLALVPGSAEANKLEETRI